MLYFSAGMPALPAFRIIWQMSSIVPVAIRHLPEHDGSGTRPCRFRPSSAASGSMSRWRPNDSTRSRSFVRPSTDHFSSSVFEGSELQMWFDAEGGVHLEEVVRWRSPACPSFARNLPAGFPRPAATPARRRHPAAGAASAAAPVRQEGPPVHRYLLLPARRPYAARITLRRVLLLDQEQVAQDADDKGHEHGHHRRLVAPALLQQPARQDRRHDARETARGVLDPGDAPDRRRGDERLRERPVVGRGQAEARQRHDREEQRRRLPTSPARRSAPCRRRRSRRS